MKNEITNMLLYKTNDCLPSAPFITTELEMTTYSYQYSGKMDNSGDMEVVDVETVRRIKLNVPVLPFEEIVDIFVRLNRYGVEYSHYYKKKVIPYDQEASPDFWVYFDKVEGNSLLSHGAGSSEQPIYIFNVMEFDYLLILKVSKFNLNIAFYNSRGKAIRDFYVFWHITDETEKDFPSGPIRTIRDFKRELIKKLEMDRAYDYTGWDPEDYTTPNIKAFHSIYHAKLEYIEQANLQELIQFVKENHILLTHEHPSKLTEYNFDLDNNPKLVNLEKMTVF